jgi:hypothetical protein
VVDKLNTLENELTSSRRKRGQFSKKDMSENLGAIVNMKKALSNLELDINNLLTASQPFGGSVRIDESTFKDNLNRNTLKALDKCHTPQKTLPELRAVMHILQKGYSAYKGQENAAANKPKPIP